MTAPILPFLLSFFGELSPSFNGGWARAAESAAATIDSPQVVEVFVSRREGYHTYRIPALIVTQKHAVLAFCEGRKYSYVDQSPTDIVLKRSFDGGKTWNSLQVIAKGDPHAMMDPCPVLDRTTGTIWLMFERYPEGSPHDSKPAGLGLDSVTVWMTHSDDDGATWSEPINITKTTKNPEWSQVIHGPGSGIQTRSGRLIIPGNHADNGWWNYLVYSDDHGKTWQISDGFVGPGLNESQVVELADGSLMLNMRNNRRKGTRTIATSKDGGSTWSEPADVSELPSPRCHGSFIRYTMSPQQEKNRLLFSNPADPDKRIKMTVRLSYDEGKTWPVAKELYAGPSQYSALTTLSDSTILCLFERDALRKVTLWRFSLAWLTDGKDRIEKDKDTLRRNAKEPIRVGDRKQLFIDRRFIARSEHVDIVMNPPVKAGVVLEADRPWEDFRLTSYFTVLQDGDRCRMYYSCFSKDQWHTPDSWDKHAYLCYAESRDGIHWEKPNLGIVEFDGSRDNNIIARSIVDGTVFIDPQASPERRYKLLSTIGPHKGGLRVSYSADGVHFTIGAEPVSPWNPDSQQNAFWDERIGKYLVYLRGIRGMNIEVKNRLVVRAEIDAIEKPWTVKPQIVMSTDAYDPPDVDFYTNACIRYRWADDAYFMFPASYHHFPPEMGNDGLLDTSMAVSRDGVQWLRPDRRPYVPIGLRDQWDALFIMMGVGIVRQGNQLYQYYNGVDLSHGGTRRMSGEDRKKWRRWSKMGRVVQRLDGFCSADAAYEGGWLQTPLIVFTGNRLELNINTSSAGHARVAIADPAKNEIPGFSIADSDKIMTNDVAHVVTWKGNSDVSSLAGRPIRLRIEMRSAKLFAFQFRR